MPNKNNSIAQTDTSIHLFVNGFSFCTPSKTEFIPTPEGEEDFKSAWTELLSFYPKGTFDQAQLISYHQPSTFVPAQFFDQQLLPNYLRFLKKLESNAVLNFDEIKNHATVNVYALPKVSLEIINSELSENRLCHYNTLLYTEVKALSASASKPYQLFIHLQQGAMDLYLTKESDIVFQNHFSIKNEDEFLYYVFFVVEQYKLNSNAYQIVFLGQIARFERHYKAITLYHSNIRFEESESCSSLEIDQHPAPFFAQSYR
jgi:hypothetical protein